MKARHLPLAAGKLATGKLATGAVIAAAVTGCAVAPAVASQTPGRAAHVVIVGIPGLRWSDVSAQTSPALYRIADQGSAGTLVEFAGLPHTCPADGWLTLNAGTRARVRHSESGPCPAMPAVEVRGNHAAVPAMSGIVTYNDTLDYSPQWGSLADGAKSADGADGADGAKSAEAADGADGAEGCALAVGPGAALALASQNGTVNDYLPDTVGLTEGALARCPLTVIGLGPVPVDTAAARAAAVKADDTELAAIAADLPPDTTLLVASPGALDKAQLGVVVIDGPGYEKGLLNASSTRQPGIVVITDLTPTVRGLLGHPDPSLGGAIITSGKRGSLHRTITGFTARQAAEQVWTSSHSLFFWAYALADVVVLASIGLIFWGSTGQKRRKRADAWQVSGVFAAALPIGTFLANLVPWAQRVHPALWLYGASVLICAVVGLAALPSGKRDPLAPFGLICLFTVLVLGIDVMTGSRLQLEAPFGLSVLEAGRFYGIGNEALGIYGIAALAGAGWLALRLPRNRALVAVSIVAVFTVFASGWPGFGGKAGGTLALVPCFLVLLLGVGGMRLTWRRALAIAVSGLVLLAIFGLINYLVPATGKSDIGSFAGGALHGKSSSGDLLMRKIRSNIGQLTVSEFSPLVPVMLVLSGLMLWRPAWFRIRTAPKALAAEPLLATILGVIWLMAVLGWFANDSGVIVPAAAMPFALPLAIAMLAAAAYHDDKARYPGTAVAGPPSLASPYS